VLLPRAQSNGKAAACQPDDPENALRVKAAARFDSVGGIISTKNDGLGGASRFLDNLV
jgi:hypothetical protein